MCQATHSAFLTSPLEGRHCDQSHFRDELTEAQRGEVISSRPQPDLEPRYFKAQDLHPSTSLGKGRYRTSGLEKPALLETYLIGKLQKSDPRGFQSPNPARSVVGQCPTHGVAQVLKQRIASRPRFAHSQQWGALCSPKALSEGKRHSLHAEEGVWPLGLQGGQGTGPQVQAGHPYPPHADPSPITAHPRPRTRGSGPAAQPHSARTSRSQFRPAHRRTTAPARRARRPSPSKAHYLTVPTRVPRHPLRELARTGAPGADGPTPGRRPPRRGRLLPVGYSTWVRVTGRHEAGSEHCPSAAILPGDRASPSSQWGARGAVVLTYHAGEAPRAQSEADTGSGAAI